MEAANYGQDYKEHLLEQYKLYVQMADNVSARRSQTNQFYISVVSALLAVVALVGKLFGGEINSRPGLINISFIAITVLGLGLCLIWFANLLSYRQLNTGKFTVIHEMEEQLPYPCYDREWDVLGRGTSPRKYLPLTHIEQYVPAIVAVPFLIVLLYTII